MPLETGTQIGQLDPANPPGTDPVSQADDHLRLIKVCVQGSLGEMVEIWGIPTNDLPLKGLNAAGDGYVEMIKVNDQDEVILATGAMSIDAVGDIDVPLGNINLANNNTLSADNGSGGGRTIARVAANGDIQIGGNAGIHIDVNGNATATAALNVTGSIQVPANQISGQNIRATGAAAAASATEGYLSANAASGCLLYGNGTAGDLTLANRSGATALQIPANTTNVVFAGNTQFDGAENSFGDFSSSGITRGIRIDSATATTNWSSNTTASSRVGYYFNPNGGVGSIDCTGTSTAYNTSSDPRLKSEFAPITGASEMILEARDQGMIGEFAFLSDPTQKVWGYNAHKLIDAQPTFGGTEGQGSRDAPLGDDVTPAGVDQSKRVPILEAAIGELLDRIRVLENA